MFRWIGRIIGADMSTETELLTTPEAAVVAGVDVRDVNRLIDERILPEDLYTNEDSRRVWAGACALIRFYYDAAPSLTAQERKYAIDTLCGEMNAKAVVRLIKTWRHKRPHWKIEHHFLTLNFDRFIADTLAEHDKLTRARTAVTEDPEILGGTPVIKGTRVPVYDVAASAAAGVPMRRLQETYPSLTRELIELAILYAKATPPRGRPRQVRRTMATSPSRKVLRRRRHEASR
ncbi:DUF433 domain-containing protein [Bradyrhizobium japonicum]|nr:DUF433 domain-containing protein [Bradyrhizobium japonicum]